jgi:hypothetical protein
MMFHPAAEIKDIDSTLYTRDKKKKKLVVCNMIIYQKPFLLIMCFVARKMIIFSDKSFQDSAGNFQRGLIYSLLHFFCNNKKFRDNRLCLSKQQLYLTKYSHKVFQNLGQDQCIED